jgi:hypothetical protein
MAENNNTIHIDKSYSDDIHIDNCKSDNIQIENTNSNNSYSENSNNHNSSSGSNNLNYTSNNNSKSYNSDGNNAHRDNSCNDNSNSDNNDIDITESNNQCKITIPVEIVTSKKEDAYLWTSANSSHPRQISLAQPPICTNSIHLPLSEQDNNDQQQPQLQQQQQYQALQTYISDNRGHSTTSENFSCGSYEQLTVHVEQYRNSELDDAFQKQPKTVQNAEQRQENRLNAKLFDTPQIRSVIAILNRFLP